MTTARGWALALCVASSAACHRPATPAQPATGKLLLIRFDGGNAFVFTPDGHRADVGAIKVLESDTRRDPSNDHRMYLRLDTGQAVPPEQGLNYQQPSTGYDSYPWWWSLQGYEIWICPDGTCPEQSSSLIGSQPTIPSQRCATTPLDNSYFLPNLMELHNSVQQQAVNLVNGWQDRLQSRMVLNAGRLSVVGATRCFSFRTQKDVVVRTQALAKGADNEAAIDYTVPFDQDVVIQFRQPGTANVAGAVRFQPTHSVLALHVQTQIDSSSYPYLKPGEEVRHFQQFYDLVDVAPPDRLKLIYEGTHIRKSPGSECPSASYGYPAVRR